MCDEISKFDKSCDCTIRLYGHFNEIWGRLNKSDNQYYEKKIEFWLSNLLPQGNYYGAKSVIGWFLVKYVLHPKKNKNKKKPKKKNNNNNKQTTEFTRLGELVIR